MTCSASDHTTSSLQSVKTSDAEGLKICPLTAYPNPSLESDISPLEGFSDRRVMAIETSLANG